MQHQYNLAAKESGLECAWVNNDNFTVLVSGGGRCHRVSMCTVWPSHSKWLSNEYAPNFVLSLNILCRNFLDDLEVFGGWCHGCSANKSAAQMLQRWLRISWKWSFFWKACNKQNTWEWWACTACNPQRSATDSVRTRSWSGDSKKYCAQDCKTRSRCETCHSFTLCWN